MVLQNLCAAAFAQKQLSNLHVVVAGDDRMLTVTVQNMNLGAGSSSWRSCTVSWI